MSNRREFFAAASSSLALASLGAPSLAMAGPTVPRRLGGSPTRSLFDSLLGQEFTVEADNGARSVLSLLAVKPQDSVQPIEQFSLVLGGNAKQALEGGLYHLEHARSGRFQLRLDPSGSASERGLYRADLCLLV